MAFNKLAKEIELAELVADVRKSVEEDDDENASERIGQTLGKLVFERTYLIHYRVNEAAGWIIIVSLRHGARKPKPGQT